MADLKLLTVRALRELAKDRLGTSFSRLKTKAELIAALEKVMSPEEAKPGASPVSSKGSAQESAGETRESASTPTRPAQGKPKVAIAREPGRLEEIAAKYTHPAEAPSIAPASKVDSTAVSSPTPAAKQGSSIGKVLPFRPSSPAPEKAVDPPRSAAAPVTSDDKPLPAAVPSGNEPTQRDASPPKMAEAATRIDPPPSDKPAPSVVPERASAEATPKPQPAPSSPPKPHVPSRDELALIAENLGELPAGYDEDDVTLLARDPHTLWVSWDFARQTERRAHEGMAHAVPVLRLFDRLRLVREVEISLEARSWYIYNVIPGHQYRAEIHYVATAGKDKQLGPASNPILVPPEGPSPVLDTHFVALPPIAPLPRPPSLSPELIAAPPFPPERRDELISLAEKLLREELPAPVIALPSPPNEQRPGEPVPPAAPAPADRTLRGHEEVRFRTRWLGSSDQVTEHYRVWVPGPGDDARLTERSRFGGRWTSSRPA